MTNDYFVVDIETTGLDRTKGHIIEFCALEVVDNKLTGNSIYSLINPPTDIPDVITDITGITKAKLIGAPSFKEFATGVINNINNKTIVAHNGVAFDYPWLVHHFNAVGFDLSCTVIDTLKLAKHQYPKQKNSLDALCDRFKIDRSDRSKHGAEIDCKLLYDVYQQLRGNEYYWVEPNEKFDKVKNDYYKLIGVTNE